VGRVAFFVGVSVDVGVGDAVFVGADVGDGVSVIVWVAVAVAECVTVGVKVGLAVGFAVNCMPKNTPATAITESAISPPITPIAAMRIRGDLARWADAAVDRPLPPADVGIITELGGGGVGGGVPGRGNAGGGVGSALGVVSNMDTARPGSARPSPEAFSEAANSLASE
jgi:hypothetical protein